MIMSFKDEETRKIFHREVSYDLPIEIQRTAYRKLAMLHAANNLINLSALPGNR